MLLKKNTFTKYGQSYIKHLKEEEKVYPYEYESFEEAKIEIDKFMIFYNQEYPHSALGNLSPIEFENLNNYKNVA